MKLRMNLVIAFGLAMAVFATANRPAEAALIVYEGFTGYTTNNLIGQQVNGNTIGLNKTMNWVSNNTAPWNVVASGLTFGSGGTTLQTSGGAVTHANGTSLATARLDIASYTGTLYVSYLVSLDLSEADANGNVHVVVGSGTTTSNRRFRSGARSGNASNQPVGVDYEGNSFINGDGHINVDNTTFMILSRFTRVGEALSASAPGDATLWALTSDQFDHFKSTGFAGIDAATVGSLSTNVTAKATESHTGSTTVVLNDTFHVQFGSGGDSPAVITFDELRMGDSFASVTPIPEPSGIVLFVIGLAGFGLMRTRRKK